MRNANDGSNLTSIRLPGELVINNERINDASDGELVINNERINDASEIASKLNAFFVSIADGLGENRSTGSTLHTLKKWVSLLIVKSLDI